jgi:hypothetical protein
MTNNKILTLYLLLLAFSGNAYSHTGPHENNWLQNIIHFATQPDHIAVIIPFMLVLGFGIGGYAIRRRIPLKQQQPFTPRQ